MLPPLTQPLHTPPFTLSPLPDEVFAFMQGRSYKTGCPVPRASLAYLRGLHVDAEGHPHVGELVVATAIAPTVLGLLEQLYAARYPIEQMRLVDYYEANDEASMRANNSSAFNYRPISHSTTLSRHSLGLALDFNPLYNPYFKTLADGTPNLEPATAAPYLDRTRAFPYKITEDDLLCRLFRQAGFTWGGHWTTCKDYQHFEWSAHSLE